MLLSTFSFDVSIASAEPEQMTMGFCLSYEMGRTLAPEDRCAKEAG